jgi:hypothetical protein
MRLEEQLGREIEAVEMPAGPRALRRR